MAPVSDRTGERRLGRTARVRIAVAVGVAIVVSVGVLIIVKVTSHRVDTSSAAETGKAPRNCRIEQLPVPSDSAPSTVMGMDSTGRYIIGWTPHPGSAAGLDLLIWADGGINRAELPGEDQVPGDVNATGVVVGTTALRSQSGAINMQAWVYRDGTATMLQGARSAEARAISDFGVVVGTEGRRPALWRSTSDAPSMLPMPESAWEGTAADITADGRTIVGALHPPHSALNRPYVWPVDGTPRELPLPVVEGTTALGALAVTITGDWVAGTAALTNGRDDVPVRWNLRTGEVRAFPALRIAGPKTSADGWMTARDDHGLAILILGARATVALPRLPDGPKRHLDVAEVISQDGLSVAGNASSAAAGGTLPVVWHCT